MPIFDTILKPTLLLNEPVARHNLHLMASRARSANVSFRPHFKTHQSLEIGEWFHAEGVTTITVSSVDMAEYFASGGWTDILLAFPVNLRQITALDTLAARVRLGLLVESVETVNALAARLSHPLDIWLKIDTGTGRTGLSWQDVPTIQAVITATLASPALRLQGLLTHAGATYSASSPAQAAETHQLSTARLAALRQSLTASGAPPLLLSVGDTPGCSFLTDFSPANEIRPGNFIFYDTQQLRTSSCTWDQIAVALACPAVALHPERSEVVVYGGAIHLSKDYTEVDGIRQYGLVCLPRGDGWGQPLEGAYVARLSQEHGILHVPPPALARLRAGDLVFILPAHSCLTVQAMGAYVTLTGKKIEILRAQ
ncbi:MAG: alanine racemase [Anaerolineaceae bacterium]|nr:alanine racemase [Anaerolineaceae bacterium]